MNNEIKNQMESEAEDVIAILERANRAFDRLFGEQEEEEPTYWSDLAELTHATQVKKFGWCSCEDQGTFVYTDCPRGGE